VGQVIRSKNRPHSPARSASPLGFGAAIVYRLKGSGPGPATFRVCRAILRRASKARRRSTTSTRPRLTKSRRCLSATRYPRGPLPVSPPPRLVQRHQGWPCSALACLASLPAAGLRACGRVQSQDPVLDRLRSGLPSIARWGPHGEPRRALRVPGWPRWRTGLILPPLGLINVTSLTSKMQRIAPVVALQTAFHVWQRYAPPSRRRSPPCGSPRPFFPLVRGGTESPTRGSRAGPRHGRTAPHIALAWPCDLAVTWRSPRHRGSWLTSRRTWRRVSNRAHRRDLAEAPRRVHRRRTISETQATRVLLRRLCTMSTT